MSGTLPVQARCSVRLTASLALCMSYKESTGARRSSKHWRTDWKLSRDPQPCDKRPSGLTNIHMSQHPHPNVHSKGHAPLTHRRARAAGPPLQQESVPILKARTKARSSWLASPHRSSWVALPRDEVIASLLSHMMPIVLRC